MEQRKKSKCGHLNVTKKLGHYKCSNPHNVELVRMERIKRNERHSLSYKNSVVTPGVYYVRLWSLGKRHVLSVGCR